MIGRFLPLLSPILLLAACSDEKKNDASADNDNTVVFAADNDTGKVSLKIPGIEAKLDLPTGLMKNSQFDIDGVKLFPGSSVTSVNVNGRDKTGSVKIGFSAPASPPEVKAYFVKSFADHGTTAVATADGLTGTDKDGSAFQLSMAPSGTSSTTGTFTIQDTDKETR